MKNSDAQFQRAAQLLQSSKKVVALTGAGVSTESGIPDFRSAGGLWSRFDPHEYGTLGAFKQDPVKVWRMLAELLEVTGARPNPGHFAMARLEELGRLSGIITQNIDGLHQKAGSREVVEFHGSLEGFSCLACGLRTTLAEVQAGSLPPRCRRCQNILKPDIIFFDELIPVTVLVRTEELLRGADLLLVIGTSCQVVPASSLPARVLEQGGSIIEINLSPVLAGSARLCLAGKFTEVMERLAGMVAGS